MARAALSTLVCARVVCGARPEVAALEHVVQRISNYLDWSVLAHWSIPRACARRFADDDVPLVRLQLLQRLMQREALTLDRFYRAAQCSAGLVHAVRNNDLVVAEWLLSTYCPNTIVSLAMEEACRLGHVHVLEWLATAHTQQILWSKAFITLAAEHGHVPVLEWLERQAPQTTWRTREALERAIVNNHVAVVEWLSSRGGFDRDRAACFAVWNGAFELAMHVYGCSSIRDLRYLSPSFGPKDMDTAARAGKWDVLRWLRDHNVSGCTTAAMNAAAARGELAVVQWLHTNCIEGCTRQAMDAAARSGHLDVIQWLHMHRREGCSHHAMDFAAAGGHLGIVKWLHTHRSEGCSTQAMDGAAAGGHLAVVEWLHTHRREGCTREAMDCAAMKGHLAVVQWLHAHRTEGCSVKAMNLAAGNGHLRVVQWLHAHRSEGCTAMAMDLAAASNHLAVVQWLHEHRMEGCTTYAMDDAVWARDFDRLLFLHTHRSEGCSHAVVHAFGAHEHIEMFQWLCAHYPEQLDTTAIRMEYRHQKYLNALLDAMDM